MHNNGDVEIKMQSMFHVEPATKVLPFTTKQSTIDMSRRKGIERRRKTPTDTETTKNREIERRAKKTSHMDIDIYTGRER